MITTSGIDPTIRLRLQKLYSCKSERGTVVLQIMIAIDDLCDINEIERD